MIDVQKWVRLTDFSAGIWNRKRKPGTTLTLPAPAGSAAETNTWGCISLPGGGLGPLPKPEVVLDSYQLVDVVANEPALPGGVFTPTVDGLFPFGGTHRIVGYDYVSNIRQPVSASPVGFSAASGATTVNVIGTLVAHVDAVSGIGHVATVTTGALPTVLAGDIIVVAVSVHDNNPTATTLISFTGTSPRLTLAPTAASANVAGTDGLKMFVATRTADGTESGKTIGVQIFYLPSAGTVKAAATVTVHVIRGPITIGGISGQSGGTGVAPTPNNASTTSAHIPLSLWATFGTSTIALPGGYSTGAVAAVASGVVGAFSGLNQGAVVKDTILASSVSDSSSATITPTATWLAVNIDFIVGATVTLPAGIAVADVLVAHAEVNVASGAAPAAITATGFTSLQNGTLTTGADNARLTLYKQVATTALSGTVQFVWTGAGAATWTVIVGAFRNVSDVGVTSVSPNGSSNTVTAASVNAPASSILLFVGAAHDTAQGIGQPAGFTSGRAVQTAAPQPLSAAMYRKDALVGAGATGAITATIASAVAAQNVGYLVTLTVAASASQPYTLASDALESGVDVLGIAFGMLFHGASDYVGRYFYNAFRAEFFDTTLTPVVAVTNEQILKNVLLASAVNLRNVFGTAYIVPNRAAPAGSEFTSVGQLVIAETFYEPQINSGTKGVYLFFNDPNVGASPNYAVNRSGAVTGWSICFVHAGRVVLVLHEDTQVNFPPRVPSGYGWWSREKMVYTLPFGTILDNGSAVGDDANPATALYEPEDPYGYGAWGSLSATDLFLVKHEGGAVVVQGDLNSKTATVRRLPYVTSTHGTECQGAIGSGGFVYGVNHGGVWSWHPKIGLDSANYLSPQLEDDFWQVQGMKDHQFPGRGTFAAWDEWILCPNNWLLDQSVPAGASAADPAAPAGSWWRVQPADDFTDTIAYWAVSPTSHAARGCVAAYGWQDRNLLAHAHDTSFEKAGTIFVDWLYGWTGSGYITGQSDLGIGVAPDGRYAVGLTDSGIGSYLASITPPAAGAVQVDANTDYTLSFYGLSSHVDNIVSITWYTAAGTVLRVDSFTPAMTLSFARYTLTETSPPAAAYAQITFTSPAFSSLTIDALQFEKGSAATPYTGFVPPSGPTNVIYKFRKTNPASEWSWQSNPIALAQQAPTDPSQPDQLWTIRQVGVVAQGATGATVAVTAIGLDGIDDTVTITLDGTGRPERHLANFAVDCSEMQLRIVATDAATGPAPHVNELFASYQPAGHVPPSN